MKKNLLLASLISLLSYISFGQSSTYKGNGKSDFGGAVGLGSININSTVDSVFFTFTKGPGLFDSVLVIYLDGQPGGVSSTAGSSGNSDPYFRAVTGYNSPTQQSAVNFPTNFQPDAAVAIDKNGGEVLYWLFGYLIQGSTFTITPAGVNNSRTYTAGFAKTDLGLASGSTVAFNFIGTYIGSNCYRSTEGIGDTSATASRVETGLPANRTSGYNTYSPKTFYSYSSLNLLPVKLTDFKVAKAGNEVAVGWYVAEESGIDEYQVQRSTDGVHFTTIGTVKAANTSVSTAYNFKDANADAGTNYYRLVIMERGRAEFSGVLTINISKVNGRFIATYAGNNLNIALNGIDAGAYNVSVFSTSGQLIQAFNLNHDGSVANKSLSLSTSIPAGLYRVALQAKGVSYTSTVIVP